MFFKDVPHLLVADDFGMQVDVGELFRDQIQQIGFSQPIDLSVKVKALEDVSDGRRKGLDI